MDSSCPPCRCGLCCEAFLIEATAGDALREPRVAGPGVPVYRRGQGDDGQTVVSEEVVGFVLNRGGAAGGA